VQLTNATTLPAADYLLLHTAYGHYIGEQVNRFIQTYGLEHKVDLVASHGHTTFHMPSKRMTAQLGEGSAIAAATGLPVVSDLRALDIAYGGQGAPIVPIGEKLLLSEYDLLLNLGGIANISSRNEQEYTAFDICAANRVLNMLANLEGLAYDDNGGLASRGSIEPALLNELNQLQYYQMNYPKSLANDFGTHTVFPIIQKYNLTTAAALHTYVEHICYQIKLSVAMLLRAEQGTEREFNSRKLLATGGGAFNNYLVRRLSETLSALQVEVVVPDENLVNYKEAIIMSLIGILRWREEYNVLASVTGARRNTVGGALWQGGEA
jgi:anhydro-N-acetylmuramic acid kinase